MMNNSPEFSEMVLRARLSLAMTPERLCAHVANGVAIYYGITIHQIRGPSRASEYAYPRFLAMRILRERGLPFQTIGDFFNRDHTAVIHACERANELMKTIPEFKRQFNELKKITK